MDVVAVADSHGYSSCVVSNCCSSFSNCGALCLVASPTETDCNADITCAAAPAGVACVDGVNPVALNLICFSKVPNTGVSIVIAVSSASFTSVGETPRSDCSAIAFAGNDLMRLVKPYCEKVATLSSLQCK